MHLHIGADITIPLRSLITILDIKATIRNNNRAILLQKKIFGKLVLDISDNKPKSIIVTNDRLYLSAISSNTLKKRAEEEFSIDDYIFDYVFTTTGGNNEY